MKDNEKHIHCAKNLSNLLVKEVLKFDHFLINVVLKYLFQRGRSGGLEWMQPKVRDLQHPSGVNQTIRGLKR